jgi:hypothetical protein
LLAASCRSRERCCGGEKWFEKETWRLRVEDGVFDASARAAAVKIKKAWRERGEFPAGVRRRMGIRTYLDVRPMSRRRWFLIGCQNGYQSINQGGIVRTPSRASAGTTALLVAAALVLAAGSGSQAAPGGRPAAEAEPVQVPGDHAQDKSKDNRKGRVSPTAR